MPAWHLRPRSAPEIVDASVQLLRQHARSLLLLAVVLMIPAALLGLVSAFAFGDLMRLDPTGAPPDLNPVAAALFVPVILVSLCWTLVTIGVLIFTASRAYVDGVTIEPADALRQVLPRSGVLLGAGILAYLLVTVQMFGLMLGFVFVVGIVVAVVSVAVGGTAAGGVLGVVAGIAAMVGVIGAGAWLAGRYVALPAVVINEALGVRAAMKRARELSRGSMKRIVGLLVLVGVLLFGVTIGGMLALGMLLGSTTAASVLVSVIHVPLYAFGAALLTVMYYDLRIRHEGLDIEMLARDIAEPTLAPSPGS